MDHHQVAVENGRAHHAVAPHPQGKAVRLALPWQVSLDLLHGQDGPARRDCAHQRHLTGPGGGHRDGPGQLRLAADAAGTAQGI